jgi:hypothetical protein
LNKVSKVDRHQALVASDNPPPLKINLQSTAHEQLTLPLGALRNRALCSSQWLEHRLPLEPEWAGLRDEAARSFCAEEAAASMRGEEFSAVNAACLQFPPPSSHRRGSLKSVKAIVVTLAASGVMVKTHEEHWSVFSAL